MKKNKIIMIVAGGAVAVFLFFFLTGNQGAIQLYQSHLQLKKSRLEIRADKNCIDSLHNEQRRLLSDTAYMERIAREQLGMARKNEKVYKFVEEKQK